MAPPLVATAWFGVEGHPDGTVKRAPLNDPEGWLAMVGVDHEDERYFKWQISGYMALGPYYSGRSKTKKAAINITDQLLKRRGWRLLPKRLQNMA